MATKYVEDFSLSHQLIAKTELHIEIVVLTASFVPGMPILL